MTERRLIISGTREALSAEDRAIVLDVVRPYVERGWSLGVGDCPTGVDALIREMWPEAHVERADWRRLGKRAGPERNGRLVAWAAEVPGGALAALPRRTSRGTWDCVRQARAADLSIVIKRLGGAR